MIILSSLIVFICLLLVMFVFLHYVPYSSIRTGMLCELGIDFMTSDWRLNRLGVPKKLLVLRKKLNIDIRAGKHLCFDKDNNIIRCTGAAIIKSNGSYKVILCSGELGTVLENDLNLFRLP